MNSRERSTPPSEQGNWWRKGDTWTTEPPSASRVALERSVVTARTLVNGAISVLDAVPGLGELPSWAADGLKFAHIFSKQIGVPLDLTPDVSKTVAVGTEVMEFTSAGFMPTHLVETSLQLRADRKHLQRLKKARHSAKQYR